MADTQAPLAGFERFESIGDNCEFGFVQRANGVERAGLLRWAVSPPEALLNVLLNDFKDLYLFENLVPSAPNMVRDVKYDLAFHTAMKTDGAIFSQPEERRREIYRSEKQKVDHLVPRFRSHLADPATIFVYKTNGGLNRHNTEALHGAIRAYGRASLLIVRPSRERDQSGAVSDCGNRLFIGHIDRFAPYSRAYETSIVAWRVLLDRTLKLATAVGAAARFGAVPHRPWDGAPRRSGRPKPIDELIANFNGDLDFAYSVHVDPDHRFIYFNNPKSACSTIKASLNLSYARYKGISLKYASMDVIHDRRLNHLLSPQQVGLQKFLMLLEDDNVFKFGFVREPLSRLASAYESKIYPNSPHLARLKHLCTADNRGKPTFEQFAAEIAANPTLRDCDEHWRLQAKQLCLYFVRYHYVGLFDNLEQDLGDVLGRFFGQSAVVFDVPQHFRGNRTNSVRRLANIDPATAKAIAVAYAPDMQLYERAKAARGSSSQQWWRYSRDIAPPQAEAADRKNPAATGTG